MYIKNHEFALSFSFKSKTTGFILSLLLSIFVTLSFSNSEKSGSHYPQCYLLTCTGKSSRIANLCLQKPTS